MIINKNTCIVFDIETLINCFTCATINTESGTIKVYEISERKNEVADIIKFFTNQKNVYFVGYNNIHFDNPIINYIIDIFQNETDYYKITKSVYNMAQYIIDKTKDPSKWIKWKYSNYFQSIDLLTMYFSQALRVSLKEIQVTMMYDNVLEMNIDWHKPLKSSRIEELISYNINDILSTYELLKTAENALKMRVGIQNKYGIDFLSKDGMKIGISVLEQKYIELTGISKDKLKELKTERPSIDLNDCILPFIKFNNKNLQDLLQKLKQTTLTETKDVLKYDIVYAGHIYTLASGGLHSQDKPGIIKPSENELLIDADVGSYYPSMIIQHGFVPEHLGKEFLQVYTNIRDERMEAKSKGDKIVNETLKLSLNGE